VARPPESGGRGTPAPTAFIKPRCAFLHKLLARLQLDSSTSPDLTKPCLPSTFLTMGFAAGSVRTAILMILTLALITTPAWMAQVPQPQTVIRINVNLVQVDAIVTDSKGKPVTDLKIDDFELLQDGKPQTITAFDFVNVREGLTRNNPPPRGGARGRGGAPIPPPTIVLRPQQIRRTIALVVDDLALSFDSSVRVRQSLKKWVDTEMRPGDLVAVIRTSAGMGALQQFTADKRLLASAIDLIRYQVGRVGTTSFAPLRGVNPPGTPDTTLFDRELERVYSIGSMGAIQYIVQGLKELPGRKSVILFSESMRLWYPDGRDQLVEEALRRLGDAANRSAVVIYAIDPRGVINTALSAEDNTSGMSPRQIASVPSRRSNQLIASQEGMITLSERTGGLFVSNNDIQGSLRQVVDDGDGYYLLGYQPERSTFDQRTGEPKFHKISVRVKRPDLHVRSRTGFFGTPDRRDPPPLTPIAQITRALSSPFATGDVRIRLTTLFAHNSKEGSSINAMLHFDANDLTFTAGPDGMRTAEIDIAAVTFDVDGHQIDGASKTWRFRLPEATYQELLKKGVVYSIRVPVKKSGAYQMRVVLRDGTSQHIGSATQFIEVPDVKSGKLALSGIMLGAEQSPTEGTPAEGPLAGEDPNAAPAVRVFKQTTTLVYAYEILNARADRNKKHQLNVDTRLFRDGEQVYGSPSEVDDRNQQDSQRLFGLGRMRLEQIPPGDYVLQIIVTDKLANEKNRIAAQSMNFEVRQ
jgi:VWFA-related protein